MSKAVGLLGRAEIEEDVKKALSAAYKPAKAQAHRAAAAVKTTRAQEVNPMKRGLLLGLTGFLAAGLTLGAGARRQTALGHHGAGRKRAVTGRRQH